METTESTATVRPPWNKGKLVGQKTPFKLKAIWAIRVRLQPAVRRRELALFNLAIDSKLRACDLVNRRVRDVCHGQTVASRTIVLQQKTQRPVQFEITEPTREAVGAWIGHAGLTSENRLYVPGGNPAPDFVNEHRAGDNLLTDSIVVLDAKTGAYQRHFQLVSRDFHDWDASTAPVLFNSRAGRHLLAEAPKDGRLHMIDLGSGKALYSLAMTRMLNTDAPITAEGTRFCPGSQGGAEWNSPAYDPALNLIFTGEVDWCATVRAASADDIARAPLGQPWSGSPDGFGKMDDTKGWAGWMTATDADSGQRIWQFKAPFPLMSGIAPTAGGLVFFGDMGGNFYAFDAAKGAKLWSTELGGAIAGGVISYDTGAGERVAVAVGMTSPIWPTPKVNGKVVVLGL